MPHQNTPQQTNGASHLHRSKLWGIFTYGLFKGQTAGSDIQQITELLQRPVCLMGQDSLGQHLAKLYAFLIKAVDVPHKTLEHDFIFKV